MKNRPELESRQSRTLSPYGVLCREELEAHEVPTCPCRSALQVAVTVAGERRVRNQNSAR